jgi:outer membrane protein OmpA-like peptidoglycan-associated protein
LGVTYAPERTELTPGQCCVWLQGGGADAAVTFWKGFGLAASLTGDHASNATPGVDINKVAFLAGPRYTYTSWVTPTGAASTPHYQIFVQGLFGGVHGFDGLYPGSSTTTSSASSLALQAGAGFNLFLTPHLGLRLLEADYVRTELPNDASNAQSDLRLAFGVVYHIGSIPPSPISFSATASPASVFPGDPVNVTAAPGNLNPKLHVIYSWAGSGVAGNGTQATVATASLAPGNYTVKVQLKEGKPGKEGFGRSAEASASFTVKPFEPPTASCSVNPTTLKPGETAAITATGVSPQNRPLTYSYSATAGSVSGNGSSAVFSSSGAPTGVTGINCAVSDDKGQTATANTSVTIVVPYVQPIPRTLALCSIAFEKDKRRPARVDNEAKACLDEVALELGKQPDAKAVLVGSSTGDEKAKTAKEAQAALKHKHIKVDDLAAERAVNAKDYLVTEKGVDAARISVATGATDGQKVEDYLVPSGASFSSDVQATIPVDETAVKPQVRTPLTSHRAARKKAQ